MALALNFGLVFRRKQQTHEKWTINPEKCYRNFISYACYVGVALFLLLRQF